MKNKEKLRRTKHLIRHRRVRKKIRGSTERPRLCVYRSLSHIYAQIIDDTRGHTLVSVSSLSPELRSSEDTTDGKAQVARQVGEVVAKKAIEKTITKVVFDKGGYKYHGRVKALAEGARAGGLEF
jgi:large subunit ribosomal protein L18